MKEIEFRACIKDIKKIVVDVYDISFSQEIIGFMNPDDTRYSFRKFNEVELLQYTGQKDKNGKMIFEGDIVKDIEGGVYKVVYDTEYMRFAFEQDSIKWGLEGFDSIMDFEVIGNIRDNPELLHA